MITQVDFGMDLGGELSAFHQICPKEGQTVRIALLNQFCKPMASHYHWHRNGFYRCNTEKDGMEAPCCKVQRSWTCVCLAILYLSAEPNGKLRKGADLKYRIGYVSLALTAYRQVLEWVKEAPGCDLCYAKADGSYSFQGVSRNPAWKLSPKAAQVKADANQWADGKKLLEKLGRKLTDAEWVRLLETGSIYELD